MGSKCCLLRIPLSSCYLWWWWWLLSLGVWYVRCVWYVCEIGSSDKFSIARSHMLHRVRPEKGMGEMGEAQRPCRLVKAQLGQPVSSTSHYRRHNSSTLAAYTNGPISSHFRTGRSMHKTHEDFLFSFLFFFFVLHPQQHQVSLSPNNNQTFPRFIHHGHQDRY